MTSPPFQQAQSCYQNVLLMALESFIMTSGKVFFVSHDVTHPASFVKKNNKNVGQVVDANASNWVGDDAEGVQEVSTEERNGAIGNMQKESGKQLTKAQQERLDRQEIERRDTETKERKARAAKLSEWATSMNASVGKVCQALDRLTYVHNRGADVTKKRSLVSKVAKKKGQGWIAMHTRANGAGSVFATMLRQETEALGSSCTQRCTH